MLLQAATSLAPELAGPEGLWAYITLAVTGIITEEATALIGGLAAHDGRLELAAVIAYVAAGTWVADLLLYYLGLRHGYRVRKRWPRVRDVILRALRIVREHPWRSSLMVRFAYGLRLTLPIACGAARLPILIYAIGSAISAVVWSVLFTLIGWGFGRSTLIILGQVRRYERILIPAIIVGVAIAWWVMRKRHVEDQTVEVLATGHRKSRPIKLPPGSESS